MTHARHYSNCLDKREDAIIIFIQINSIETHSDFGCQKKSRAESLRMQSLLGEETTRVVEDDPHHSFQPTPFGDG
jgi:hypothetical protein